MPALSSSANEAILRVANAIGELMQFWGFKRNMGRMWCVLYLSPEPLSAAQLSERLSLSTGAVSMLLTDLSQWGVVKKAWVPGKRRDYYEAESNIWKMVSRVYQQRELRLIGTVMETFTQAIDVLEEQRAQASPRHRPALDMALERIAGLRSLAGIGQTLLESILSGHSVDTRPLEKFEPE